jgi:dienelactone hydrolase
MSLLMKQLPTLMIIVLLSKGLCAFDDGLASPNTGQTGKFKTQASAIELLGETAAQRYAPIMPVDDLIEWEVYVPSTYDAAKPAGLLVYVSPHDSGRIPSQWETLMAESNLIWVAAIQSGNEVSPRRRMAYALLATAMIAREYRIARERIYVSGFSGGGRIASMLATKFPGLFKGAIYNCGVNFWDEPTSESLELIKNNRFVFITGSEDFNLRDTRRVFRKYEKAGVQQIKLMVIPHMGHSNPGRSEYAQAITYLDDIPATALSSED